jgi:hypothetical protein
VEDRDDGWCDDDGKSVDVIVQSAVWRRSGGVTVTSSVLPGLGAVPLRWTLRFAGAGFAMWGALPLGLTLERGSRFAGSHLCDVGSFVSQIDIG